MSFPGILGTGLLGEFELGSGESGGAITSVYPVSAVRGYTHQLNIVGSGVEWDVTSVVSFSGSGITVDAFEVVSETELLVTVTIAAGAALTARDITVSTGGDDVVGEGLFTPAVEGATATLRNGFQYTLLIRGEDIRRNPSIQITEALGNSPNSCTFTLDGSAPVPKSGEEVEITDSHDGDRLLFAGVVQSVQTRYEERTNQLVWDVVASDFTFWLNRKRPFGYYNRVSATNVVKDLCARYAPWVDSTSFVQTDLCKVTISFDGSQDFASCLTTLARQLGSGQWYLDYQKRLHFFHVVSEVVASPSDPESVVVNEVADLSSPGIGEGLTAEQADGVTDSHTPHWAIYRTTFVYSNGMESGLSKISNPLWRPGNRGVSLSNIPVGPPVGGLTCVSRRIYAEIHTQVGTSWVPTVVIGNNTATTYEGRMVRSFEGIPVRPFIAPPPGPVTPLSAALSSDSLMDADEALPIPNPLGATKSMTPCRISFAVTGVYEDGTETQPNPPSNAVTQPGSSAFDLSNIPIFPTLNGVSCVYRKVYAATAPAGDPDWFSPGRVHGVWLINNNDATSATIGVGFTLREQGSENTPTGAPTAGQTIVDPCTDGPFLEDSLDQPDDITDDSNELLREPQLAIVSDVSQVRNRIYVRGAGTVTTSDAAVGSTALRVADLAALPPGGGLISVGTLGAQYNIRALSGFSGPGTVVLASALTQAVPSGSPVRGTIVVNDLASQRLIGRLELDEDGQPTDGIHEFYVDDPSLVTIAQQIARGQAELELFSLPTVTVTYGTRDPNSHPGRRVMFDLTEPPVSGEFLIQQVSIDQIHDDSDELMPRYTVTASSVRFTLEDLLLLIAESAANPAVITKGGTSNTGLVETAVADANENTAVVQEELETQIAAIPLSPVTIVEHDFSPITGSNNLFTAIPGEPGYIIQVMWMSLVTIVKNGNPFSNAPSLRIRHRNQSTDSFGDLATQLSSNGTQTITEITPSGFTFSSVPGDVADDPTGEDVVAVFTANPAGGGSPQANCKLTLMYRMVEQPDVP